MPKLKVSITRDIYPPDGLKFAYVRHPTWKEGMNPQEPSAVQCYPAGVGINVKADVVPVSETAWAHIRATNDIDGIRYAESVGSLLCNRPPSTTNGIYKYEAIISGGNIVAYSEENANRIKLVAFDYMARFDLLKTNINNFFTEPWRFFECSAYDNEGHSGLVWGDVYCFVPKLIKGEHWMNKTDLWLFPPAYNNIRFRNGVEVWNGNSPLVIFENGNRVLKDPNFIPPASVIPPGNRSLYIKEVL